MPYSPGACLINMLATFAIHPVEILDDGNKYCYYIPEDEVLFAIVNLAHTTNTKLTIYKIDDHYIFIYR